jgi:hypothetical protein
MENVTTLIVDMAKNHFESFFEESLPQLIKNDFQYFRFVNMIFTSLLCREATRIVLERTGIVAKWCTLAKNLLMSEVAELLKTDALGFLVTCWLDLPDYFEAIPDLVNAVLAWLSSTAAASSSNVLHAVCVARLAELLEKFSDSKRAVAPEIYRMMIALLEAADKNPSRRDRLIQAFIYLFLNTQIPSAVLLDTYLPHFQSKLGIDIELNVFDLDFLKFLVRDKRISNRFKLMFFDIFCKILLSTSYGASIFLEVVELSTDILASDQRSLVFKFFEVAMRFFVSTYKARKLTPGQIIDLQQVQAHRRTLVCRYFISLVRNLQADQGALEVVKEKTLIKYFEIKEFLENDKRRGTTKADPKGLKDILAQFGDVDAQLEEYMRANNIYYGSDMAAADGRKKQAVGKEDEDLARRAEEKLAAGIAVTQEERKALTKVQNAARIQAMKEKMRQPKKDDKEPESKLELYNKLREKGIIDDPAGIEKLEDFKRKLRERQERQMEAFADEKIQDLKVKENLHTLLQQRRVELGVESSFIADDDTEKLIYPLDSYDKNKLKFEVDTGMVELDLLDLERLEKLDADAVRFKMLEYRKLWRNIFNLYSNCLKGFEKGSDFNKIKDQLSRISRMEFWKFVKDYGLTNFITQEEIAVLFKLINTRMKKVHSDLSYLDYEGHKELMLQCIYLMFTRPPVDLSHLPPAATIDKFVELVKKKYKDEGLKSDFFEDANKFSIMSDPQVVDHLNAQLAKDPDHPVPHTYEKITEKKVVYTPKLCEALKVPESYEVCYALVTSLVKTITE